MKKKISNKDKWNATVFLMVWLIGIGMIGISEAVAYERQSIRENGVRVEVVPIQVEQGRQIRFEVRMNTHSVPLDQDLMTVSALKDDRGNIFDPVSWKGSPPGGHHRSGILSFPKMSANMNMLTLIFKGVSGVEKREFQWTIDK